VYAFYDPKFSFRDLTDRYPDAKGEVTDCLSGDVNKDFSQLWRRVSEFVELPGELPVGAPLVEQMPEVKGRKSGVRTQPRKGSGSRSRVADPL
jgi:hypothetical protein